MISLHAATQPQVYYYAAQIESTLTSIDSLIKNKLYFWTPGSYVHLTGSLGNDSLKRSKKLEVVINQWKIRTRS